MTEQLRIHQRRRLRIPAGEANPAAALRIQPHDADGKAVSERKRESVAIAARCLEDHLNIRPRRARAACVRSRWPRTRCWPAGPLRNSAYSSRFTTPARSCAPGDAVGLGVLHLHQHRHGQMIVVVRPDSGQVLLHRDAGGAQLVLVPDARQHQQLGREDRTGGNNDLAARGELPLRRRRSAHSTPTARRFSMTICGGAGVGQDREIAAAAGRVADRRSRWTRDVR